MLFSSIFKGGTVRATQLIPVWRNEHATHVVPIRLVNPREINHYSVLKAQGVGQSLYLSLNITFLVNVG